MIRPLRLPFDWQGADAGAPTVPARPWRLHIVIAAAGALFSLVVTQAFALEPRYVAAFGAAVLLLALALGLVTHLSELLVYVVAFNLAFTSIEKTFLITDAATFVTSGVAVGLADLTLAALYLLWFVRVFVTRRERLPRLTTLDKWIGAFVAVHLLSELSSVSPLLTLYEVVRLTKYALAYFYLAHNLQRRHLKWVVAGVIFTIAVQSSAAIVQQRTGKLMGIGRTKGASELQYEQYTVTGFESVRRAEGTTFDSHALGLFMAMTLVIPMALALSEHVPTRYRALAAAAFVVGAPALAVSFARAAWLAFAAAATVTLLCFALAREWRSVRIAVALVLFLGLPAIVPFAGSIKQRLFEAPPELVSARTETSEMGLQIWKDHPWTGCGANGYMVALQNKFSVFEGDPYFIPAHNMVVYVLTEIGVIGLVVFLGLSWAIVRANLRIVKATDPVVRALGIALLAAFVAFHVEGITDPIYVTNVTYFLLWFEVGLTGALLRLAEPAAPAPRVARLAQA